MRLNESWLEAGLANLVQRTKKKPAGLGPTGFQIGYVLKAYARAATRFVKRENFRATVFLWRTPVAMPRAISGWAA